MSWHERAAKVTPNGCQTMSKRAYPEGYPETIDRGFGPYVLTSGGRQLVDWVNSLATVTLGHAHPAVTDAIMRQIQDGGTFALPHALETEVGERLCEILGYEQVRWSTTGSEASEAAVRVARMATGRDLVLTHGYHSWFATFSAARPTHPGCPEAFRTVMQEFATVGELADRLSAETVAAVIIEPAKFTHAELETLIELAQAVGTLVIFDEVVSGFRYAVAGVQELYGVRPDLSIYGKALTNGSFPLSALVGPASLMKHAWPVSGTYSGHPVGLAAVDAVLDVYEKEPVITHLWTQGQKFHDEFNQLAATWSASIPLRCGGDLVRPIITLTEPRRDSATYDRDRVLPVFLSACANAGALFHPAGNNVSYAHDEQAMLETMAACSAGFQAVMEECIL